jgi:hypothetical protein
LNFGRYERFVTNGWLKTVWEKTQVLNFRIELGNIKLDPIMEGDTWFMVELGQSQMQYNVDELICLTKVRLHQQVLFLSDILDAWGTAIDRKYLWRLLLSERWSCITFPIENPPQRYFRLCKQTLFRLAMCWSGCGRMQGFSFLGIQSGIGDRIWRWRHFII